MENNEVKSNGWALIPFIVFAAFYVGLSLWANDFYKVPMTLAFVIASAVALLFGCGKSLTERIDVYAKGMGSVNIMVMCLIFILSGAFATVAKGAGAVDAVVLIARSLIPSKLMLAGVFLISCLISLAIGTSCGTIAAITPIAIGFIEPLNLSPALLIGAVIGGAMFGDNLSMISDTTIAATRTQGIAMRDKFIANLGIAAPAAIVCLAVYTVIGFQHGGAVPPPDAAVTWQDVVLVIPYLLILVLAIIGLNVMFLLFLGTLLAGLCGVLLGKFGTWDALDLFGKGALGMSETLIVAILAGGLFAAIQANGGVKWLTDKISLFVRGPRTCELGVFILVSVINLFTANNTVAIVIAGPIAKECSARFKADSVRIASVLDTASCIIQGIIPYGAQILIAMGIAKTAGLQMSTADLISRLFYQPLLAIAVFAAMVLYGIASIGRPREA